MVHALSETKNIDRNSDLYGKAFEHFIAMEIRAFLSYTKSDEKLMFWRSKHGHEVDCLVGERLAIEVKATRKIRESDLSGLRALAEEKICRQYIVVSHDPHETKDRDIHAMPWNVFLKRLWESDLINTH